MRWFLAFSIVFASTALVIADEDPLAELAALGDALGDSGPEGGGSIRAKRDVDPAIAAQLKDKRNVSGKVEAVRLGKFPAVAVRIKVVKPAESGPGQDFQQNDEIVVVPKMKVSAGRVDMSDPDTVTNAAAYYLQEGDKVLLRIDSKRGSAWQVAWIQRK